MNTAGSTYTAGLYADVENRTIAIDLSRDWTNSSLTLISTARPTQAPSLSNSALWWDSATNAVTCYGGSNDGWAITRSIWQFSGSENGSVDWSEALGPTGLRPYPSNIIRAAAGAFTNDARNGYYIGGVESVSTTDTGVPYGSFLPVPGLLEFNYDGKTLNNLSDGGFCASQHPDNSVWVPPGAMVNVDIFGTAGVLILLGGDGAFFNNITIYDRDKRVWYSQFAGGQIPDPRCTFCTVGAQSSDNTTYEMYAISESSKSALTSE